MKLIDDIVARIDKLQRDKSVLGLPIAIIKKYGEDDAGYQAALITYYGFLSLFPLLLVATSIVGILSLGDQALEAKIMRSVNTYFPVIGDQLSRNIHSSSKSGAALIIGLVVTFYGARGGADAFRKALAHVWKVPKAKQPGFPKSILLSLGTTALGGLGLSLAAIISAYAAGLGRSILFKGLSLVVGWSILIPTFYFVYRINLPSSEVTNHDLKISAAFTSLAIIAVQSFGGYLVANQLHTLSPLYGTFALVLGILFWIYLQATIVMYAMEIRIVRSQRLWPRGLNNKNPTAADRQVASK